MSSEATFNKENLDTFLRELGREFRKLNGKTTPAEIIIIGGAAILANYGFREITTDIDAIIHATSAMKDAVNSVGDKFDLPNGWLNSDFTHIDSFSPELSRHSKYYRTFSNILTVRTIEAEYLIAMKMRAGRKYKHDLSDIVGILAEHEKRGEPITLDSVKTAVANLYGSWESISEDMQVFIEEVYQNGDFEHLYAKVATEEAESKEMLIELQNNYPGITNTENVDDILAAAKKKKLSVQISDAEQRYLESIAHDAVSGKAHFAEHDLIE